MNDKEFREFLRYSTFQHRRQPSDVTRPSLELSQVELNHLYGLPDDFAPPSEADVRNAVDEVLQDLAPHKATPVMSRGKTMQNTLYDTFNAHGLLDAMLDDQQDIFYGLCRSPLTDGDTSQFSPRMLFMLLKSMKKLNPEAIVNWLNIKRKLRDYPLITLRHAQKLGQKMMAIIENWEGYGFVLEGVTTEDYDYELPEN